ncbi:MAG: dihydropteroate synthase [Anaerolineae bacterium]|jgi:5-methyltetrahydrofolate--homocysteine methyltransferase|nr:dihydropteroate synthase [Anaerolineae bacterium]
METVLSSKTKTVVISPDRPFVIIGERINPTGRKKLAEELANGDFSRVRSDALAQVEAGAAILDVNAGVPGGDEPEIMRQAVQMVMDTVDLPLSIDSANPDALEAGLALYQGKALINSTTGEDEALERVLPLAKKYGAAVIALCNDERGPVQDPQVRLDIAKKIVARAADHGVPIEDLLFDPLVMTVGADSNAGRVTLATMQLLRAELGVNLTAGASNVSFGLPDRPALNAAFMAMAMNSGLNSAITNPLEPAVLTAILAADLFLGHDEYGRMWIKGFRKREKAKAAAAA